MFSTSMRIVEQRQQSPVRGKAVATSQCLPGDTFPPVCPAIRQPVHRSKAHFSLSIFLVAGPGDQRQFMLSFWTPYVHAYHSFLVKRCRDTLSDSVPRRKQVLPPRGRFFKVESPAQINQSIPFLGVQVQTNLPGFGSYRVALKSRYKAWNLVNVWSMQAIFTGCRFSLRCVSTKCLTSTFHRRTAFRKVKKLKSKVI